MTWSRLLKKTGVLLGLLILVSFLSFSIIHFVPGGPVAAMLGTQYSEIEAANLRESLGLNEPYLVQYWNWLHGFFSGDLGDSLVTGTPVVQLVWSHLEITLALSFLAFLIALMFGVPLGMLLGNIRSKQIGAPALAISLIGMSIPNFWLGALLILFFSYLLNLLPSSGYFGPEYLILPSCALALSVMGVILRTTSESLRNNLDSEFVKVLRAKGLSEKVILWKHLLKVSFLPVLTISGIQLGYLLGGAVVIEKLFALPGIGLLTLNSLQSRDYPVIQASVLIAATSFILINLIVDASYQFLDPRLRKPNET